ncbi:hypothetical protein M431DRAFT_295989 [Trichoderma harzianum CBS 226.95]|uniref:Uncharacterized protein n=1 Tax=Trichoderma harzianum CBS 226.95 TaxID=983964 RepID=A0A2T4AQ11_TRIHA|nr:hypothetical protein M431DRAFT_295989 [Trichoderma harzianum CBS 226.95]PTB59153.1 hypothetical protein M431DRAFT_295989 [Trichoderma harzianum CBS 226.95]
MADFAIKDSLSNQLQNCLRTWKFYWRNLSQLLLCISGAWLHSLVVSLLILDYNGELVSIVLEVLGIDALSKRYIG